MKDTTNWDVIVVGAGPGGAASAVFLARAGWSVLVLEKSEFPRFQIGESLLPVCLPILDELGVKPSESAFVYKRGAQFVDEQRGEARTFDFARTLPGTPPHAWQVNRAGFDQQLCGLAAEAGAEVHHGEKVKKLTLDQDQVEVVTEAASYRARFLIDASGQNRLVARTLGTAQPLGDFGQTAVYSHFDDVSQEVMDELAPENDIRVMITRDAWGWIIPLPDRRLSIGQVRKNPGGPADFERYLADSPLITRYTRGARRTEPRVVRNFSFRNLASSGTRYACVGDAACFLDPVFSSGVSLALYCSKQVCSAVIPALREGREAESGLLTEVSEEMARGYDAFAAIIQRFYDTHFIDHFVFGNLKEESIERGITSMLAGDVWRSDNTLQNAMVKSRKSLRVPRSTPYEAAVTSTPADVAKPAVAVT